MLNTEQDRVIKETMDLQSKNIAIAFGEFIATPIYKIRWLKSVQKWTNSKDELFTTEELYTLFLTHINK